MDDRDVRAGIQALDCGQHLTGVCPVGESRWQIGRPEQGDHLGVIGAGDPGTVSGEQFYVFHGIERGLWPMLHSINATHSCRNEPTWPP